jgi:hypothetical protein
MKLNVSINRHTTSSELVHLGMLFTALGLNAGAKVFAAPTDAAELDEPEVTHVAVSPEHEAEIDAATGSTPKKRRRIKADIEAAVAEAAAAEAAKAVEAEVTRIAEAEAEAHRSNEAGLKAIEEQGAIAPGEPGNDHPAPTPIAPPPATPQSEPAKTEPVTESPSDAGKTYTPAEVQGLAVDTARRYGPEKVKALIATYPGAAKIADLPESELPGFVAKLQAITA